MKTSFSKTLIVADGLPESKAFIVQQRKGRTLIATDGAANDLRKKRLTPDVIIGDFDSITPRVRNAFDKQGVAFHETPDQNFSDLEKAIMFALQHGATDIVILSALGKRTDHTLKNISLLKKFFSSKISIRLVSATEDIRLVTGKHRLSGKAGSRVSVVALTKAVVSSRGLKYDMTNYVLELGKSESTSNALSATTAHLEIHGKAILIQERTR
jgi:thiamine pyrophosphokinase